MTLPRSRGIGVAFWGFWIVTVNPGGYLTT
jgi:hypothetical protein